MQFKCFEIELFKLIALFCCSKLRDGTEMGDKRAAREC